MIKLFGGGKADHPMATVKEVKVILDALPATDSGKALEELAHWMNSVVGAEGFKLEDRIQRLFAVDDAAHARIRKLAREYLAAVRPSKFQEARLWTVVHEYWRQSAHAYARCVDQFAQNAKGADGAKSQLAPLLTRALRSLSQQLKWMHLRYGPIDAVAWAAINNVYAFAEKRKVAQARVPASAAITVESSPQDEFVRAAVFSGSSPDSLLPLEAELAERLISEFAGGFTVSETAAAEHFLWTSLSQPSAPQRLVRPPPPEPGQRFIDGAAAVAALEPVIRETESSGAVPSSVNLGGTFETERVLDVMRHLASCWSTTPVERRHPRHNVKSRLAVVHGIDAVIDALEGDSGTSLNFDGRPDESWIVENVSAGGFCAAVPQLKGDWLQVGALIAMQPEGGANWVVGVVRRVNKATAQEARVGIETLSKAPVATRLEISGSFGTNQSVVMLRPGDPATGESRLVMPLGAFVAGQNLESQRSGKHHVYMALGVAERGDDYEIARFREMIRES